MFVVELPTGVKTPTNSAEQVVRILKTWGVSKLNPKKPPARLKQKGMHEFAGSGQKVIKVHVN